MSQDTKTIDHNNITEVSSLFREAFGDFGDDWLIGILFAHTTEQGKERAVERALDFINARKENQ